MIFDSLRSKLWDIGSNSLKVVHGERCVYQYLSSKQRLPVPIYLVAIGKAAVAMCHGAFVAWGSDIVEGLVISKYGHGNDLDSGLPVSYFEAAHPIPDENSLRAGEMLLQRLCTWPAQASVLFLISGGSSALIEVLKPGIDLSQLQQLNRWLMAAGMDIGNTNLLRARLSMIKCGQLIAYLGERPSMQLLLSDVPDDDPAVIGSGPLVKQSAAHIPMRSPELSWLTWMKPYMQGSFLPVAQESVQMAIVGSNRLLRAQAAQLAAAKQIAVRWQSFIDGDVNLAAAQICESLGQGITGLYIWGGETTVRLCDQPGRGGRNQHLALLLAERMQNLPFSCLCLATDGSDGPVQEAGALVDGHSIERGCRQGLDVYASLAAFDSGNFLAATGDLIHTEATGTNVMDLILVLLAKDG